MTQEISYSPLSFVFEERLRRLLEKNEGAQWHWSDITQTEIISRLFPGDRRAKIDLDGIIPGIYWKPWSLPPRESTFLDIEVGKLVEACLKENPNLKAKLLAYGIDCPFYAWRYHVACAADKANKAYLYINRNRMKKLENELRQWTSKINISKNICRLDPEICLPEGSIYLNPEDTNEDIIRGLRADRQNVIEQLHEEIKRDERIVKSLEQEIQRLSSLIPEGTGRASPDAWKTPFFIYLANIWRMFTGKDIPFRNESLDSILQAATRVICKGSNSISVWSLTKTLRNKIFKENLYGYGFRIYETGNMNIDSYENICRRGDGIRALMDIAQGKTESIPYVKSLAEGAILLRDYNEGELSTLVRDAVIRSSLEKLNLINPRIALQLGWLKASTEREIRQAYTAATFRSQQGDLPAFGVTQIVGDPKDGGSLNMVDGLQWRPTGDSLVALRTELANHEARSPSELRAYLGRVC